MSQSGTSNNEVTIKYCSQEQCSLKCVTIEMGRPHVFYEYPVVFNKVFHLYSLHILYLFNYLLYSCFPRQSSISHKYDNVVFIPINIIVLWYKYCKK